MDEEAVPPTSRNEDFHVNRKGNTFSEETKEKIGKINDLIRNVTSLLSLDDPRNPLDDFQISEEILVDRVQAIESLKSFKLMEQNTNSLLVSEMSKVELSEIYDQSNCFAQCMKELENADRYLKSS